MDSQWLLFDEIMEPEHDIPEVPLNAMSDYLAKVPIIVEAAQILPKDLALGYAVAVCPYCQVQTIQYEGGGLRQGCPHLDKTVLAENYFVYREVG